MAATATKKRTTKRTTEPEAHNNGTAIKVIRADRLLVDTGYQRVSQGSRRAKRISGKFRWKDVHLFLVAPRPGGMFACVDGGHRLAAIEDRFPGFIDRQGRDIHLRCEVLRKSQKVNGNYVAEADSFLGAQNEQRNVNANDAFKARLYANERAAVDTFDIAEKNGITVKFRQLGEPFTAGPNETKNGGVLYWAFCFLGETLYKRYCRLLAKFRNDDGDIQTKAMQGAFMRGLAYFIKHTEVSPREIMTAVPYCDSAADIAERACTYKSWSTKRSLLMSNEIERALKNASRLA